jgi:hypothetical protein
MHSIQTNPVLLFCSPQVVDMAEELELRGLPASSSGAVLDAGLSLGFSVWVSGPQDIAARFGVALMLDDGTMPLRSFQTFVRRDSSHHFFSRPLPAPNGYWKRCGGGGEGEGALKWGIGSCRGRGGMGLWYQGRKMILHYIHGFELLWYLGWRTAACVLLY